MRLARVWEISCARPDERAEREKSQKRSVGFKAAREKIPRLTFVRGARGSSGSSGHNNDI